MLASEREAKANILPYHFITVKNKVLGSLNISVLHLFSNLCGFLIFGMEIFLSVYNVSIVTYSVFNASFSVSKVCQVLNIQIPLTGDLVRIIIL